MKIAIIGSGIAAFEAAGTARTLSPEAAVSYTHLTLPTILRV